MSKRLKLLQAVKNYNYDIVKNTLATDKQMKVLKDLNKRIQIKK